VEAVYVLALGVAPFGVEARELRVFHRRETVDRVWPPFDLKVVRNPRVQLLIAAVELPTEAVHPNVRCRADVPRADVDVVDVK
jgi:hypothetical protein